MSHTEVCETLYIFGGDSTALEIFETAERSFESSSIEIYHVVPANEGPDGERRINIERLDTHAEGRLGGYILSTANPAVRDSCRQTAEGLGLCPMSVIHPSATVSRTATIGNGVYVAAQAVVSAHAVVHDHVLINYHCVVGHHSEIGQDAVLNPGAKIGGRSAVGKRSLIGANSFVHQNRRIGDDVIVDAMTYVHQDIGDGLLISCRNKNGRPLRRPFFPRKAGD
ncbi:Putative acetyltransferase EpsM [Stieleria neptunia]|uniref:Acetyltransferase EpsM n=2 Tax=Stieleria neptunia TaxID=2527979 RepID=A0A518HNA2_9BACT|nr:Putative acetyltransferase EpsM [Stieleria neptunia]